MARLKRATSQLVRWHAEYEDALTEAHDLGVPDRALADAGAPGIPARSTARTPTAPSRNPAGGDTSRGADDEGSDAGRGNGEPLSATPQQPPELGEFRDHVPADIRDVSLPTVVRGYDRRAVDAYVKRVNRVIAELEVGRSPQAAVRNALERVGAQTSGILQQARETAEEITASAAAEAGETTGRAKAEAEEITASARAEANETTARARAEAEETTGRAKTEGEEILARSRSEADARVQKAEAEVETLREQAEARMRKVNADAEAIWQERGALVEEVRQLAARLEEIASAAEARFPSRESFAQRGQGMRQQGEREAESADVAPMDYQSGATPDDR
jgi:DivIVA domain-containing protein